MRSLRISAISYLNTVPLMWDFEHGAAGKAFEVGYTLPLACAQALAEGSADIGIIPAAAYGQIPGLQVIPEVAIASRRQSGRSCWLAKSRLIRFVRWPWIPRR
jgi:chorismate dehydratase